MLVSLVLLLVMGKSAIVGTPEPGSTVAVYGYEAELVNAAGQIQMGVVIPFLVLGAILLALMAMVFRNVYLILKNSQGTTPFQPDNVRMVREIGIFLFAQPVVSLLASVVTRLAAGADVEISVNMSSVIVGLVVLCLSRIFARGMELEADVDGLM